MEPMDVGDDSTGFTSQMFPSASSTRQRVNRSGRSSAPPCFSSSASQVGFRPQFGLAQGNPVSFSTPRKEHHQSLNAPLFRHREPWNLSEHFVTSSPNTSFVSPIPVQPSLSRGQSSAFERPRSARVSSGTALSQQTFYSPGGAGLLSDDASMETSNRSDVSEMEVVQSSPSASTSWERVRSALSSISLLGNEPVNEQTTQRESPALKEKFKDENQVVRSTGKDRKAWEPSLSAVQAAGASKRGRRSKTPSPSKSSDTVTAPSVLSRKTQGDGKSEMGGRLRSAAVSSTPKSKLCYGRCCLKLSSLVLVVLAGILAFVLQMKIQAQQCDSDRMDPELLRNEMASQVFGQHIAIKVIPDSMREYFTALQVDKTRDSCHNSSLVLSFHGWTGVGKNFVSDIIASSFQCKTVTKFLVPYHFPHQHLDHQYRSQVEDWVLSNVTDFSVNFFIFDEMDKATSGVTAGIQNAISRLYRRNSCHSPSVFLFLSNTFGADINKQVFQTMLDQQSRHDLKLEHFSHLFSSSEESWYKQLQPSITITVPFLPLEKKHVVQCIRRDLVSKQLSTHADLVNRVLQELLFTKLPDGQEFSQTGCKRVSDKVNFVAFE